MRERKIWAAYRKTTLFQKNLVLTAALSLASIVSRGKSKMWFSADIIARIQNAQTAKLDPEEAKLWKEAERKIEETGRATCAHCGEEIAKNDSVPGGGWIWESEAMVGYCDKGDLGHKHKPLVRWKPEEGVVNV